MKCTTSEPQRPRLAILALCAAALWAGCSADADDATQGNAALQPDSGRKIAAEASEDEEEEAADAGASDAGQKDAGKKDGSAGKDASSGSDAAVAVDASTKDAASLDASAPGCNTVAATSVSPKAASGFAPALTGGTPLDGVYHLVSSTQYIGGTSGTTFPTKGAGIEISGSTLQLKVTAPSFGIVKTSSYTFTVAGSRMKLTRTCPTPGTLEWSFSASGNKLIIQGLESSSAWYDVLEQ